MPELPEVETIKRGLVPCIEGRRIRELIVLTEKSCQGDSGVAKDAVVKGLRRRGKALLIDLDNGWTLMIHLRMTGQLIWRDNSFSLASSLSDSPVRSHGMSNTAPLRASNLPRPSSKKPSLSSVPQQFAGGHPSNNFTADLPNGQTRVIFVFNEGKLFFNDQRKFGFVKVLRTEAVEEDAFIAALAPEPWEMNAHGLYEKCQRHAKAPIKAVLLDQKIIAGLGNIYADESLFYAGVHPAEKAGNLSEKQVAKLLEGARETMERSIDSGGSTMATYIKPDGTMGDYLENFAEVFRREGQACNHCGETILKTRVAGRGTHYCPKCQPAPAGWNEVGSTSSRRVQVSYAEKLMPEARK